MTKVIPLIVFYCLCNFLQVTVASAIDVGYRASDKTIGKSAIAYNTETEACETDEDCNLTGYCDDDGECECGYGLSGRTCEIVDGCVESPDMCGSDPDARCAYDYNSKRAICRCKTKGKRFDAQSKTCVAQKTCESYKQCLNGGQCWGPKQGTKYCRCKHATSGDFCELVDECIANPDYCGSNSGAECRYNTYLEKPYCQCKDKNQRFDWPQKKCVDRKSCRVNDECLPYGVCHNKCSHWEACLDYDHVEKIRSCHCIEGTSGENCKIIDDCYNKIVDCGTSGGATCNYYYNHGLAAYAYCKCRDSEYTFDNHEKVCKECDCGPMSKECYFKDGKKSCICSGGAYFDGEQCKDCNCGEGVKRCTITNDKLQCICKRDYVLKNEKCHKK